MSRDMSKERPILLWYITGTFHGSHVYAVSEGKARAMFHAHYGGESIVDVSGPHWPEPIPLDEEP